MHVLVIAHSYYPTEDPRSFRWQAICEAWVRLGLQVDVVTAHLEKSWLKQETLNGVVIYRTRDLSSLLRTPSKSDEAGQEKPSFLRQLKQRLSLSLKRLVLFFRWPDYAWLWIPSAFLLTRKLLKEKTYQGVVSVAYPFSSHVVAMLLGKQKKGLPWLCDYGDPFSFLKDSTLNNRFLYQRLSKSIEQRIMQTSQKLSVTTLETANEYLNYLKLEPYWFKVIPPLVNEQKMQAFPLRRVKDHKEVIRLLFVGRLYAAIRNPSFLLRLLKTAQITYQKPVEMHFYGPIGDCKTVFDAFHEDLNQWLFIHGQVDKALLPSIYQHADVLVNIGNANHYQAPSKIIEYMALGLPILNITSISNDSSSVLLKEYPASLTLFEGDGLSAFVLTQFWEFIERKQCVASDALHELLKPYYATSVAESYWHYLIAKHGDLMVNKLNEVE